MRIIVLANNKGGITKTTTTINLGYGMARAGRRVLIIDTDAQCNATYSLLGRMDLEPNLFDVLIQGGKLAPSIVHTREPRLDLVPSSINLSAADLLMGGMPGRERKLARAVSQVKDYDYVLIDTPPNLGVLTVNAFVASTSVIIPIALTTYALIGISILERTMQELRENMEIDLPILGVVANLYDRTRMSADVLSVCREHFGDLVFETLIPRNIKVEEAHNRLTSIYDYASESTGAKAYAALTKEVLSRAEETQ